jgi:hypothetical protein
MLEMQRACFNEFPVQCNGCSEYRETRQDYTDRLILLTGMTFYPQPLVKVVKERKAFHKRVLEYQR